jgi:glycosyltransferase involved in cell wall biosynthesis
MKILMVSSDYLPNPGGISGHVYELSRELAELGHEVDLIVGHNEIHSQLDTAPLPENAKIIENISFPWTYRGYIGYIRKVSALIQKAEKIKNYDLIHWHNLTWETLAIRKSKTSLPKIFTNHSSGFLRRMKVKWRKTLQMPWILGHADWIITPSQELLDQSIDAKYPSEQLTFVPNGVNVNQFTKNNLNPDLLKKYDLEEGHPVIILPRRLDPKNGVDILVKSMGQVVKELPELKVLFVGDGQEKDNLIQIATHNGSLNNLIFCGSQPRSMMPDHLSLAHLAVLPSRAEAVSLAGLEAMSCELPVIGSRVGGIPEFVIPGETGELFTCEDHDELAQKIINFFAKPKHEREAIGKTARNFVKENFSWTSSAEKTLSVYKKLIHHNK